MIWRLPHPLLGLLAGLAMFLGITSAAGFGVGLAELLVIALLSVATTLLVGGWRPGRAE